MAAAYTRMALFIGAGFSYELGMPLVWELTKELCDWLTGDKLRELNRGWMKQGQGTRIEIIEEFIPHLENSNLHYEQKIAWLEDRYLDRRDPGREGYHGLLIWMTEMVGHIINIRHLNNLSYIPDGCELYRGLASLGDEGRPLWVFSLNHDACVEALCAALDIPLRDGFPSDYVTFPTSDGAPARFARLPAPGFRDGLSFGGDRERCVNLLKLHGSIDTFRYTDDRDWLKLRPRGTTAADVLRETSGLEAALRKDPTFGKALGEIACLDETGEVQFLRRTLLSGGHKFQGVIDHNAPMEVLGVMRSALERSVSTLVLIGYSGGDEHINQELRGWMDGREDRHLVFVDPYKDSPPGVLDQWPGRVELRKERTTDFLSRVGNAPRTAEQEALRKARAFIRRRKAEGKDSDLQAAMHAFVQEEMLNASVEYALSQPADAQPATPDEARKMLAEHLAAKGLTPEALMQRFIDLHADEGT